MASKVIIIDATLRQHTVKVQPGAYIIDILDDACRKWSLASERYQLKHRNKTLNLTDPFRTAGLSPGAKLELIKKSQTTTVVTVALRLPESESRLGIPSNRVMDKFRSDTTVWKVLRHLEESGTGKEKRLNLTARGVPEALRPLQRGSGQLYWEVPVLTVAGRELCTIADFQKTLAQIGIDSGSQLIMLNFKSTEMTLQEAMEQVEQSLKEHSEEVNPEASQSEATPTAAPTETQIVKTEKTPGPQIESPAAPPKESVEENSVSESGAESTTTHSVPSPSQQQPITAPMTAELPPGDPLKPIEVVAPSSSATIAAATSRDPDSAFTPSAAQMTAHQQSFGPRTHNQRLKSDKELAADAATEEARLAAIRRVDVRVRFPNGYQALWALGPDASGALLYRAVLGLLVHDKVHFKLVLPAGGGTVDNTEKKTLVRGYGMRGGVLLNFVWLDTVPANVRKEYLTDEATRGAHEVVVPNAPEAIDEAGPVKVQPQPEKSNGEGSTKGKLPKWLKLPGKK